jgi:hypothetical protein
MVKLTPDQQAKFVKASSRDLLSRRRQMGLKGSANVRLSSADKATLKSALARKDQRH